MEKDYLFSFLYYALIEFREDAYQKKDKRTFYIADMLHNLPMQLKNAQTADRYKEILEEVEGRAEDQLGLQKWIEHIKQHVDTSSHES